MIPPSEHAGAGLIARASDQNVQCLCLGQFLNHYKG